MKKYILGVLLLNILSYAQQMIIDPADTIIFAAGSSTRFGKLKVIEPIGGLPMVCHAIKAALDLGLEITVVIGHEKELVKNEILNVFPNHSINFAIQEEQLGTGHALQCTREFWHADDILIMNGDHPLTNASLLQTFIDDHKRTDAQFSILTAEAGPNCKYGRIIKENDRTRIVEAVDFKNNPKDYPLVNAGFYLIKRSFLEQHIDELWLHNNKNEYYITDLIEIAGKNNINVNLVPVPFHYVYGVNTQEEFAQAKKLLKQAHE